MTAILSNAPPTMLEAAVECAGIGDALDAVISADALGIYKPVGRSLPAGRGRARGRAGAGELPVVERMGCGGARPHSDFVSCGANRTDQARERLPDPPDVEIRTLDELPAIVLP